MSVYVSEGPAPSLKCHRFVPTFRPLPILKDSHSSIERVRLNRREDHPHAQPQRNMVTGHNSYPSLNLYLTEQRHPPTTLTLPKPNGLHPPKPPVPLFIPQHSTPPYSICTLLPTSLPNPPSIPPPPSQPKATNQPTNQTEPNRVLSLQPQPLQQLLDLTQQDLIIQRISRALVARDLAVQRADDGVGGRAFLSEVNCFVFGDVGGRVGVGVGVGDGRKEGVDVLVEEVVDAGVFEAKAEALGEVVADTVILSALVVAFGAWSPPGCGKGERDGLRGRKRGLHTRPTTRCYPSPVCL